MGWPIVCVVSIGSDWVEMGFLSAEKAARKGQNQEAAHSGEAHERASIANGTVGRIREFYKLSPSVKSF